MNLSGGVVRRLIYERGNPFIIVGRKNGDLKVYLNPRIIPPEIIQLGETALVGMEILSIKGEFSPQGHDLFFPENLIVASSTGISDYRLRFD